MDSVRRRTRRQSDEILIKKYNELKRRNDQESSGNADDSENTVAGSNDGRSVESSQSRPSRNAAGKKADILASEKTRKLGKKGNTNIGDSSDEQVVTNGSSLKVGPESGSGSGSKVDHFDEVVSSSTMENSTEKQVHHHHHHVSVDSGKESSDDSDTSFDSSESESESTSEVDDEFSDEDYEEGKSPASESSSDDSSCGGGSEQEKEEEDDDMDGENEKLKRTLFGNEKSTRMDSRKESSRNEKEKEEEHIEGGWITISELEFSRAQKRIRVSKERETLERDDGGSGRKEDEDVVMVTDDETFLTIKKNAKKNQKLGDGKYDGKGNVFGLEVDSDKVEMNLPKCFRSSKISESKEKDPKLGKCNTQVESISSSDDEYQYSKYDYSPHFDRVAKRDKLRWEKNVMLGKKRLLTKLDLIKILVDSINAQKDNQFSVEKNVLPRDSLPTQFRFEDEVEPPKKKTEWEEEIDSLFLDLELGLRESETDSTNFSEVEKSDLDSMVTNETPAARCRRGEHLAILDEERGIVCQYCHAVILDIKYVLPPFYIPPSCRRETKDCDDSLGSFTDQIQFPGSAGRSYDECNTCIRGTVWELIPGIERGMFPHQREGFEFIWKNIAGDIMIEKLQEKQTLSDGQGCIISHAPGTGKTRLTIVFLRTFLKLFPTCCPVVIAPRSMLLTWESEFVKWEFDAPFHNLNKKELSGNESAVAFQIFGQVGAGIMSTEVVRLLKLYSWTVGGGILGISYTLFKTLAGENGKAGLHEEIRKVLLRRPGLVVLDEGHTPRNDRSLIWKALSKVATQRRIILSGTPFQNNLVELYNTLYLVNRNILNQIGLGDGTRKGRVSKKKWKALTSSIGKNKDDGLKKIKAMLDPFVHVHKGNILEESIPGLRHTLVFLHPTECQKTLLETSTKVRNILSRIHLVSLVSVHPSLILATKRHSVDKRKLEEIESDVDAGVKMKFLMKLIWLADALKERVLVFSQFLEPLLFIKKQIESHLSWNEGRELLYMDGKLDEKQRQDSIYSFNDDTSKAKVLLASERACSEGISLVGASRVVLLDTVWNPSVEKQAISRAYRLGQKKVVHVYRLFTTGIEVRQFAQQIKKVRLSELIFSHGSGQTEQAQNPALVSEDKILESMLRLERFNGIFENIICQPKESDIIQIFGLT